MPKGTGFSGKPLDLPASPHTQQPPSPSTSLSPHSALADLERKMNDVKEEFNKALMLLSEKENQKFDLIFAILTELQSKQPQLEQTLQSLSQQISAGQVTPTGAGNQVAPLPAGNMGNNMPPSPQGGIPGQQGQFPATPTGQQIFSPMSPMAAQMQPMNPMGRPVAVVGQQPMQQYPGGMVQDGTQMFTPILVVQTQMPMEGNMPYAVPQVMSPAAGMAPMAIQYMDQGRQDMNGYSGITENHHGQQAVLNGMMVGGNGCESQAQVPGQDMHGNE